MKERGSLNFTTMRVFSFCLGRIKQSSCGCAIVDAVIKRF